MVLRMLLQVPLLQRRDSSVRFRGIRGRGGHWHLLLLGDRLHRLRRGLCHDRLLGLLLRFLDVLPVLCLVERLWE